LLSGFSQTFTQSLILRALFGIGMGGEWGVGASLAMEQAPRKWRGVLSGILQSGYSIGYLLAAVAARTVLPTLGWRWMFWLGPLPALLALYIRTKVPESEAWREHRGKLRRDAARRARSSQRLRLSRAAHDIHDVSLSWHAGPVPRFPQRAPRQRDHHSLDRHSV